MLKEAYQLDCGNFDTSDAMVAKNWLKRVSRTFEDIDLKDEFFTTIASQLPSKLPLEKISSLGQILKEFEDEFYTLFNRDQEPWIFEVDSGWEVSDWVWYPAEGLMNFVKELAGTEEMLYLKF